MPANQIEISEQTIIDLAIYAWRLEVWSKNNPDMPSPTVPRYVVRGLNKVLEECRATAVDITGNVFDSGLACDVVDSVEVDTVKPGESIIGETIAPIVSINGRVVKHGQVVLHTGRTSKLTGVEN